MMYMHIIRQNNFLHSCKIHDKTSISYVINKEERERESVYVCVYGRLRFCIDN